MAADGSAGELASRASPDADYSDACWLPDDSIILSRVNRTGLLRYDPSTRRVAPVPGTERLLYPKCSRQGDVLASGLGSTPHVRRSGSTKWKELGVGVGLAYPNWTRDGRSICGMALNRSIECFDVEEGRVAVIADASAVKIARAGDLWMGLDAEDRPLVMAAEETAGALVIHWEAP